MVIINHSSSKYNEDLVHALSKYSFCKLTNWHPYSSIWCVIQARIWSQSNVIYVEFGFCLLTILYLHVSYIIIRAFLKYWFSTVIIYTNIICHLLVAILSFCYLCTIGEHCYISPALNLILNTHCYRWRDCLRALNYLWILYKVLLRQEWCYFNVFRIFDTNEGTSRAVQIKQDIQVEAVWRPADLLIYW